MWIERLEIGGFGRLSGDFDFGEGLTVVQGSNEAGKSTLHDALVRSMFGFSRSERRLKSGGSVIESRAPWGGGPFGLVAHVHVAGGPLRIEWSFSAERRQQQLRLREGRTGEELTSRVAAKANDYTLGEYLLGIDLEAYRQWGCLDQAAGGRVLAEKGFVDSLRSVSETGSEEAGVDEALALIDAARKSDAIGVHARTGKPLADRDYQRAVDRRERLEAAIEEAEAVRDQLEEEARELERIEAEEAGLRERIARLERERLLARRARLQTTLEQAREAGARAAAADDGEAPDVPADIAAEVRSLHQRVEELRSARAEAESRRQATEGELAKLLSEAASLDAEIQALAAYRSLDASREGEIGSLLGGLHERERALAAAEERLAAIDATSEPGTLGEETLPGAGGVDGAGTAGANSSASPAEWGAPAAIGAVSLAGGVLLSPVLFAGLLVAVAVYWWLRQRRVDEAAGEQARQADERARIAAEREAVLAHQRARRQAERQAREEAAARLKQRQVELAEALDAVGAAPGEAGARAEAYLEACRQAERLAGLLSRRAGIGERQRTLNEPSGQIEQLDSELERRTTRLGELLHSLGISARGPEAIAELDRMEAASRRAGERRATAAEAAEGLRRILQGTTIEELEAKLRDVESELEGHRARHEVAEVAPRAEAEVARDHDRAVAERTDAVGRLRTAEQRVADLEAKLAGVPAWRAELAEVERKIARIRAAVEALAIADEQLAASAKEAHRRSVPGLNRAIAAELPRLTEGRYTEATVDEELEITLIAPETNKAVSAEQLSQGTQDQIYLVERLAILELHSRNATEPPPLLLDDAFAHFDADRRRAALELLAEKAEDRQIVLFVDEPEVAEELDRLGAEFGAIALPSPLDRVGT